MSEEKRLVIFPAEMALSGFAIMEDTKVKKFQAVSRCCQDRMVYMTGNADIFCSFCKTKLPNINGGSNAAPTVFNTKDQDSIRFHTWLLHWTGYTGRDLVINWN